MRSALDALSTYLQKYMRRLKGENVMYIKQLLAILKALTKAIPNLYETSQKVASTTAFIAAAKLPGINLLSLVRYVHQSEIMKKVHAYHDHISEEKMMVLDFLPSLLSALMSAAHASRVILEKNEEGNDIIFSYYLIHPAAEFRAIVDEARSVIFAGGTMGNVSLFFFSIAK